MKVFKVLADGFEWQTFETENERQEWVDDLVRRWLAGSKAYHVKFRGNSLVLFDGHTGKEYVVTYETEGVAA